MKKLLCFLLILSGYGSRGQDNYIDLVWSDEFDTDGAPDPSNWGFDLGHGQDGWGNREVQSYTSNSANVRVEGGMLIIQALKDQNGDWASARVKSQGKRSFTYGRIVWRARLPAGSGTWSALWLLGENVTTTGWPASGEIDVMEHVGKWPGQILSAIHTTSSHGDTQNKGFGEASTFNTAFHNYELLWTPEKLAFYVDGVNHYTYAPTTKNASTWPFDSPFFLIMNIAMGGGLGSDPQYETNGLKNGIDPALTTATMEIDYVRVYQSFEGLSLEGPNIVARHQTGLRFKTNNLTDAAYEWSVPPGAEIIGGQGTSEIQVDWGETEGNVKVVVTIDGTASEKEMPVTHVVKPQGAVFPLSAPVFPIEWSDADPVNEFNISEEAGATRVDYQVTAPGTTPSLVGELHRAVDLTDHPILKIRAKSSNESGTLRMRIDLEDENGRTTNKAPVFNLSPLIDDGEYYDYPFNFDESNQWQGDGGAVDATRITKINVFVDFGVFGSAGSDSLWIESIEVMQAPAVAVTNRPSHLSGLLDGESIRLSWQDNSDNETQFNLYYAEASEGPYTLHTVVDANTTTADFPASGEDPFSYYFNVTASGVAGETTASNIFHLRQTITSVGEVAVDGFSVYPNPSSGRTIFIAFPHPNAIVKIHDLHGNEKLCLNSTSTPVYLDLRHFPAGLYWLSISGKSMRAGRRLLLL